MPTPSSTPTSGGSPSDTGPVPAVVPTGRDRAFLRPKPPRRVLVVEPSESERARLGEELSAGGLEVAIATDLADAVEESTRVEPGLILAPWRLLSGTGLDLLRRLAGDAATAGIPVILHGGEATVDERVEAFELGAFDVLTTAPGAAELRARLRAALRVRARMIDLERQAYRDALTGLINRVAMEDQLRRLWEASRRHGTSLSVLMIDVDRLKAINDTFGHPAGDDALRRTAAVLSRSVRGSDVVARYGGDEFVVVAPGCPPASAVSLAVRFRAGLAAAPDPDPTGTAIPITLSIGIAGTDGPTPIGPDELFRRADQALYLAKRSGRDAVALDDPSRAGPATVMPREPP